MSASGLGVVAEAPAADQGDEVGVTLRAPGVAPIEVRALVWHVRTVSRNAGEKPPRVFGLVLSDAAPEFAQLVERLTPKPAQPAAPPRAEAPPQPAPPAGRQYRIRIKQSGGSRTCRIVASGDSPDAAAQAALAEVGPGWIVLEVAAV